MKRAVSSFWWPLLGGAMIVFILVNWASALQYNWVHDELTEIQMLKRAANWAIPWRWLP